MAPFLSTCASRFTSSPPSSDLRMPHVFVIPPEEEQQDNPPWCCFDADKRTENSGDLPLDPHTHSLDGPNHSQQDVPVPLSRYTSGRQQGLRGPFSKKLEKIQRPEAIKIVENKPSHARQRDSDVIEVVKVKRSRELFVDPEENITFKRSKTLKTRATKALRSIKNVGKGSHRTHVKEIWTSSESMPGIFKGIQEQIRSQQDQSEHRPRTASVKKGFLSRTNPRSFSQIFLSAKSSQPESSSTASAAPSVTLPGAYHTLPAGNPSSLSYLWYNNTNPSFDEASSTLTLKDAQNRPTSNRPMRKNTKFSVRELHRLFSFSPSSLDDPSSELTARTVPLSSARNSPVPSTSSVSSFDYLDVPMNEDIYADAHSPDIKTPDRSPTPRYRQAFRTHRVGGPSPSCRLSDLSFELKLDSLHFDALSFDPEDFDVSMEGSVLS